MDDWKAKLSGLLGDPSLPAGDDIKEEEASSRTVTTKLPRLDIILDRKRAGKTATIIAGFTDSDDIDAIARMIKQRLGAGGSARGGEILLQGDRRDSVGPLLSEMGYKWRII